MQNAANFRNMQLWGQLGNKLSWEGRKRHPLLPRHTGRGMSRPWTGETSLRQGGWDSLWVRKLVVSGQGLEKNKAACYGSCRGKDITSLTAPFLSEEPVGIWHATGPQILVWSQFIKGWMKTWEIDTERQMERETLSPTTDYQYMLTPLTFKSQV